MLDDSTAQINRTDLTAEEINDNDMIRRAVGIFGDPSHNLFVTALPSKRHACYSPHALDHICTFAGSVSDGRSTYFGVNPVGDVYGHTKDSDVVRRRWLFIDVDRNKGLQPNDPATDQEHDDTQTLGLDIAFCLRERGYPEPVFCDSGNGCHLYYRIDLPNDSASRSLIASALTRLSELFAGDVRGDIGVECYDARRLSRLPGTWSRRGDESAERPYRMCRLVSVPATFEVVPAELLREIAGTQTKPSQPAKGTSFPPLTASGSGEAAQKRAYAKVAIAGEHANGRLSDKERAAKYLRTVDPANSGCGGHDHTFATVRAVAYGFDLSEADALEVLAPWNATCNPPWSDKELLHKVTDALTKPFDRPRGYLRDAERTPAAPSPSARHHGQTEAEAQAKSDAAAALEDMSAGELMDRYPNMRPPVIDGLLRVGECMNLIAGPKTNKSWKTLGIACSVATGRPVMGFPTTQGNVLILDNELHLETLSSRLRRVTRAFGCEAEARERIRVLSVRGKLQDLRSLGAFFRKKKPGEFKLIIIDAWYRTLPIGTNENDNPDITDLYNLLDSYADYLQAAFLLVHHTSKGLQSEKSVTDVGAGAGAQSRAADTHLVMRPHEEDGAVVVEAVVRSFPPVKPVVLRFQWPFFVSASDLDPTQLAKAGRRKKKPEPIPEEQPDEFPSDEPPEVPWTSERFAQTFGTAEPKTKAVMLDEARLAGINSRLAASLLSIAIERAQLFAKSAKNDARIVHIQNVPFAAKKPSRNGNRQAKKRGG